MHAHAHDMVLGEEGTEKSGITITVTIDQCDRIGRVDARALFYLSILSVGRLVILR